MSTEAETVLICRACMKNDGIFLPMFGDDLEKKNLHGKLAEIAEIEINEHDGLPAVLCPKCAYRTDAFYDFKLQVKKSQDNLRKMLLTSSQPATPPPPPPQNIPDEIVNAEFTPAPQTFKPTPNPLDFSTETTEFEAVEDLNDFLIPNNTEFSINKEELITDEMSDELQDILDSDDVSYTFLYIPSDEVGLNLNQDGEADGNFVNILMSTEENENTVTKLNQNVYTTDEEQSNNHNGNYQLTATEEQNMLNQQNHHITTNNTNFIENTKGESDSDSLEDSGDNILGSLNDTVVKIKHLQSESGKLIYQCSLCVENYEELTSVLGHTVDNHIPSSGPFFCMVCEKDCISHKDLRIHIKIHTGPNPYICFLCSKAYSTKRYLKRHMSCHTDFPRHRCVKCGTRFKTKSELVAHATSHVGSAPFTCDQCPRIFNHKGNYKRHLITHLDPQGVRLPKYPCHVCGKRFLNNRTLQTHIRVHTGEKPFTCQYCNKSFSQQGNLLNHVKIHSNPRSYTCEVCGKSFNQRATLRDHGLLHTGEKPHVCTVCGIAFTFSAALRRHMWVHSDVKPFSCTVCDARFTGRYDLNRHMRIHSDEPRMPRRRKNQAVDNKSVVSEQTTVDATLVEQIVMDENAQPRESEKENVDALYNLVQYS